MSKVLFISDLHLGHQNILKFSPTRGGTDMKSHSEWLVDQWNSVVTNQDLVWVLGDVCFNPIHMTYLNAMRGTKHLILGNHCKFPLEKYSKYFNRIHGFLKYKESWLSHAPIHPDSLRNLINIHGHLHGGNVMKLNPETNEREKDKRYFNVSVEQLNGVPISYEDILERTRP